MNLEACERLNLAGTEVGVMIRLLDKFMRLVTFAKHSVLKVKNEGVTDTLLDVVNYAILLAAIIQSKRKAGKNAKRI